jgi:hypothetical protein
MGVSKAGDNKRGEARRTSARRGWASSLTLLSRQGLFGAGSLSSSSSPPTRDTVSSGAGVGELRFLDSASFCGVLDGDVDARVGDNTGRVPTAFALTGLSCALPSLLTLGEHAFGSRAPRTRRLAGDASISAAWIGRQTTSPVVTVAASVGEVLQTKDQQPVETEESVKERMGGVADRGKRVLKTTQPPSRSRTKPETGPSNNKRT